ncbi:MAG TPA: phosphotransferase [Mycobacteriales bacterium]|jgi:Phosphotransferase enzyme family.
MPTGLATSARRSWTSCSLVTLLFRIRHGKIMAIPRIDWAALPAAVQDAVETHTGPVLHADTASAGDNSAVAATLHTRAGRVFAKGIPTDHRQVWTQHEEARINPHVLAIAPRLLWQVETGGWHLLGFEHVAGRHADYSPGSPDLPAVAEAVRAVNGIPCPDLPIKAMSQRLAEFASDPADLRLLDGDSLLHTDFAPHNVLITGRGALVVDWAWPTRGPAWVDVAVAAMRLMGAGHTVIQAEAWADQFPVWQTAPRRAVDVFVTLSARLWRQVSCGNPRPWSVRLAAASGQWADHLAYRV